MPRKLTDESQMMAVHDPVSGTVLNLYYRIPTSQERLAYQTSVFRIEGEQRQVRLAETRLQYGLEILTGFAPGDFTVILEGEEIPLDPERCTDWKDYLAWYAGDLISFLGQYVFEGLRVDRRREAGDGNKPETGDGRPGANARLCPPFSPVSGRPSALGE